jgi:dTDP-4-dehydrorhamnose reductase
LSICGRTKLLGEQRVREYCPQHLIFRLSGLYGIRGENPFTTALRAIRDEKPLQVVDDRIVSPNWCPLVAEAIAVAIETMFATQFTKKIPFGTYHVSGAGSTSWYEFSRLIYEHADKVWNISCPRLTPVHTEKYGAPAKRPLYSVLNPSKYETTFGHQLPDWNAQFLHCINGIKWGQ